MILPLVRIPVVDGIYGADRDGDGDGDVFPERMRFLHPDAAPSFLEHLRPRVEVSDMFRSAEASLAAKASKQGVQPPAFSAHNFGLAIDVDVVNTLRAQGWEYGDLLNFMAQHQWYCYRRDGKRGKEDWHFTFLGPEPREILSRIDPRPWLGRRTWSQAAELAIQQRFASQFMVDRVSAQTALQKLRLYSGKIDGKADGLTDQAVGLFARQWSLKPALGDPRFQRVLAYVAADVQVAA